MHFLKNNPNLVQAWDLAKVPPCLNLLVTAVTADHQWQFGTQKYKILFSAFRQGPSVLFTLMQIWHSAIKD
jgi:hypothetical protein